MHRLNSWPRNLAKSTKRGVHSCFNVHDIGHCAAASWKGLAKGVDSVRGEEANLGLLADIEDTTAWASMTLLKLKSAILTRQCLSTSRLGDFKSLCRIGGLWECSCSMPCKQCSIGVQSAKAVVQQTMLLDREHDSR